MIPVFKDIVNLFFPAQCHLCGKNLSPHEDFICTPCMAHLPRTGYHRNLKNPMVERFAGQFPFVTATGHFFYTRESALASLIQDMKYRSFPSLGVKLGKLAAEELYSTGHYNDLEYIVPLPMHFLKEARRGYNQAERIAKGISDVFGIPVVNAMKMTRRRKTQTALSRSGRLDNAENLFAMKKGFDLSDKHVLLVDDICTTGATMGSAAQALTKANPGIKLYLFTLGVTF